MGIFFRLGNPQLALAKGCEVLGQRIVETLPIKCARQFEVIGVPCEHNEVG